MVRTLKNRFIAVSMAAITFLLVFLLGGITLVNTYSQISRTQDILSFLTQNTQQYIFGNLGSGTIKMDNNGFMDRFIKSPIDENTPMSNVYFSARITEGLTFANLDISRVATMTQEDAESIVIRAYNSGKSQGRIDSFMFKKVNAFDGSLVFVFLDTTNTRADIIRVIILSLFGGTICWLVMLLIVSLLSKKAITPIARNMERQKQFITDAGHEIKTPLAIILANTEALELHSEESKWTQNIKNQVTRLGGLMQTLLTMAKLDETKAKLELADVNVSKLIRDTEQMFTEPANLKGIRILSSVDEGVVIKGNQEHISRIFSILFDNAVKYAPENGFIAYKLIRKDKGLLLEIRNNCDNLPEGDIKKLFDRFYRGDTARTQKSGGYGIGLSALKAMVELYGGKVTVKKELETEIVFTVKL